MDAKLLFFTVIMSVISCAFGYPAERSEEVGLTDSVVSSVKGSGQKIVDKFDQVFYGLLDEAVQKYITEDDKGKFKDMVLRHRGDLVHNIKENFVNKKDIELDDVKKAVMREIQNRVELFNYVGSGVWGKVRSWSGQLMGHYKRHCEQNGSSIICFGGDKKKDGQSSIKEEAPETNEVEREFSDV